MQHIGILLAGGKGSRMKRPGDDKLLREVHNSTPFRLCYESFLGSKIVDNVIIVYRDNDQLEKINQEIDVAHKKFKKSFSPIFFQTYFFSTRNFFGRIFVSSKIC